MKKLPFPHFPISNMSEPRIVLTSGLPFETKNPVSFSSPSSFTILRQEKGAGDAVWFSWLVIIVSYLGSQASANPETTPSWEPILGPWPARPKMDPRKVTRLVERTAVGEGGRGWVSKG
jgi:hypothetical protein